MVTWTESVGLTLVHRDITSMRLKTPQGQILVYNILQIFPFTSETKRMGIIIRVRILINDAFYLSFVVSFATMYEVFRWKVFGVVFRENAW